MNDPRVDAYIKKSEAFARPILKHVRQIVHKACPDIEEGIKWGMPFFILGGKNLANMAAFKAHAVFGFWEGLNVETPKAGEAMGHFGRIKSLDDLPADDELITLIRSVATKLAESQASKKPAVKKRPVKVPTMPGDLAAALAANARAQKTYDGFAQGHKRDYIEWVIEAKREATRQKRIAQAVEWMAEGKNRHWKYR